MTAPLVEGHIDLRDFAYMPLDVVRLRDSDLAAISTGDGFRAAVMLWCAAWHQVPAASLPDDDRMLARLSGYGRDIEGWRYVKDDALRNFVKCDDGRLYHPTIAEKACEAWDAKCRQRDRTAAARAARLAQNARQQCDVGNNGETTKSVTENVTATVTESKGREGKGIDREEEKKEPRASALDRLAEQSAFDRFWRIWPNRVGKPVAIKSFAKVWREADAIIAGVESYIATKPADRSWMNPSTFLNQRRWEDMPAPEPQARAGPNAKPISGVAQLWMECQDRENERRDQEKTDFGVVRRLPVPDGEASGRRGDDGGGLPRNDIEILIGNSVRRM